MNTYRPPQAAARKVMERPAARELIPRLDSESFRWIEHDYPSPLARWNYHPEVEIHLIRHGTGSYLIGDQIGAFGPGHVAVVGAGLPHDWMSDLAPGEVIESRDAVIQFLPGWLDQTSQIIPELREVKALIDQSSRGIVFSGPTAVDAAELIELVGATRGTERIGHLFTLLALLCAAPASDRHLVAHELYSSDVGREGKAAVDAGLAYVLENLTGDVRMSDAAKLAHMSESTFSKHFKKASGMTFSALVKRLRIASACRMLEQTDSSIASISTAVGYRNLANFNRQFRAEVGMTPRAYRTLEADEKPDLRFPTLRQHRQRLLPDADTRT